MGGIHDVWLLPCMAEFLASILIILSGIPLMNIKNKLSFLLQVPEKLKHWICEFCFRRSRHLVYLTPACGKTVVKGRNQTILLGLRLTTTLQPDLINVPASPNPYFQHPATNACVDPRLLAFSNIQCSAIQDKTAAARSDRFQCNWSRAWNRWMLLRILTGVLPALEKSRPIVVEMLNQLWEGNLSDACSLCTRFCILSYSLNIGTHQYIDIGCCTNISSLFQQWWKVNYILVRDNNAKSC